MLFPSIFIFSHRPQFSWKNIFLTALNTSNLLHLCFLQEELCRWRMTWSYHSSCCYVLWSSASSVALQNFSNLFTVSYRITVCFYHRISIAHVMKADKWLVFLYCSESAVSKVQSPPARTARRSQSKAKSRPLEPEVDLQLLKTLCQENDCNSEEVGGPSPCIDIL